MSQDLNQSNFSSGQPGDYSSDPKPGKKNSNTWIYGLIIVVLLGTNIYLFVNKNKIADQNKEVTSQRDSAIVDRNELENEYQGALVRLDDLVSKNTTLNNEINDRDSEIGKLKKEIQGIVSNKNATAADLKRARGLITQLNDKVKGYEERIAQLETENQGLNESNTTLSRERDSTVNENVTIKKLGSVLHASNIRMQPIDLRKGGKKEVTTGKAKKVDLLRIYFDIDENRIAESGNKELYLKITGPDGNLLSNAAYGSGITTLADGNSLNYTLQKEVNLQKAQPVKDIIVDWNQENDYKRGSYNIEIYNEGYKVGSGMVNLK